MVFNAKKDSFRWWISGFVFVVYGIVSLIIYLTEKDLRALLTLGSIWLLLSFFIVWLLPRTTRYTFLDDHLLCQCMGIKKRIYYNTFNKVLRSNGMYAGWKMSTAWKCLIVRYNKYDELLISPENEAEFIALFESKKAESVEA